MNIDKTSVFGPLFFAVSLGIVLGCAIAKYHQNRLNREYFEAGVIAGTHATLDMAKVVIETKTRPDDPNQWVFDRIKTDKPALWKSIYGEGK